MMEILKYNGSYLSTSSKKNVSGLADKDASVLEEEARVEESAVPIKMLYFSLSSLLKNLNK